MGTEITSPVEKVRTGSILMFGGATAPQGYLMCDANSYQTVDYPDLFAVIGYTFGGSGASFKVPQFMSYLAKGADGFGGLEPVGTAAGQLRGAHTHAITGGGGMGLITSPANAGNQPSGGLVNTLTQRAHTHTVMGATDNADVQPQYLCVNFIIKT